MSSINTQSGSGDPGPGRTFDTWIRRIVWWIQVVAAFVTVVGFLFAIIQYYFGDIADLFSNDCRPGMVLGPGDSCDYPDHSDEFRVTQAGASLLGSTNVVSGTLKVDYNADSYTFQARELSGTGEWRVEVAGLWRDAGEPPHWFCSVGLIVDPGEYCIDEETKAQFRVYAVDMLWRGDDRPLYKDGYGVLYYFGGERSPAQGEPLLSNQLVEHGSFRAEAIDPTESGNIRSWRIVSVIETETVASVTEQARQLAIDQPRQNCEISVDSVPAANERDVAYVRQVLAGFLFCTSSPADDAYFDLSDHAGDYGMDAPLGKDGCDWRGGHAGWHLQTKSVAGDDVTADEIFYSLTAGTVIRAEEGEHGDGSEWSVIAVYDESRGRTTIYKRARTILVEPGDRVEVGTQLGIQGGHPRLDGPENELVHIEVRDGEQSEPACGVADGDTFDPINDDYLIESVLRAAKERNAKR